MPDEGKDLFAKMKADMEQTKAGLGEMAGFIRAYFEGLIEHGFSEAQAMELTTHFQSTMIFNSMQNDDED